MDKLRGKIALVTGGSSGIGLATAKRFAEEGAYVFITGRREAELAAAVKEISVNVTGVQGDVASFSDLDRLFDRIKWEKGRLDIVFANAGASKYAPLGSISEEMFDGSNVSRSCRAILHRLHSSSTITVRSCDLLIRSLLQHTANRKLQVVNRWNEKAGLRAGCCTLPSYRRAQSANR
jgi:NADP-dependent 3-hydroxy acid dehydrogenase YdfG